MRFIDCANCLYSQPNQRKERNGKLLDVWRRHVKAIFLQRKSDCFTKSSAHGNGKEKLQVIHRKYPIERKNRIKNRDLAKQRLIAIAGNNDNNDNKGNVFSHRM